MNREKLNRMLGPMKRKDLMRWAANQYMANVSLQQRIVNQRATYRRFVETLKSKIKPTEGV